MPLSKTSALMKASHIYLIGGTRQLLLAGEMMQHFLEGIDLLRN